MVGAGGFVVPIVPVAVTWALAVAAAEAKRSRAAESIIVVKRGGSWIYEICLGDEQRKENGLVVDADVGGGRR
jgi:hypothetical protein